MDQGDLWHLILKLGANIGFVWLQHISERERMYGNISIVVCIMWYFAYTSEILGKDSFKVEFAGRCKILRWKFKIQNRRFYANTYQLFKQGSICILTMYAMTDESCFLKL